MTPEQTARCAVVAELLRDWASESLDIPEGIDVLIPEAADLLELLASEGPKP